MRYEFDSEVLKKLSLNQLMTERHTLEELYSHVRLLCDRKEEELLESIEVTTEKRETTKKSNKWINKKVAERRVG